MFDENTKHKLLIMQLGGLLEELTVAKARTGLIIGAEIYYLIKRKNDSESKKIYGITTLVEFIIMVVMILILVL